MELSTYVTTVELRPVSTDPERGRVASFTYDLSSIDQMFVVYDFLALVPKVLRVLHGGPPPLNVIRIIASRVELPGFPINFWFLHDRMFSGTDVRPLFTRRMEPCSITFDQELQFPVAARGRCFNTNDR